MLILKTNSNARIYVKGVNLELNKIDYKAHPKVKKQVQIEAVIILSLYSGEGRPLYNRGYTAEF